MNFDLPNISRNAIKIIHSLGDEVHGGKRKVITEKKGYNNFVTNMDLYIQYELEKRLKELVPQSIVMAEEKENSDLSQVYPTWIIDPIDGTTNFLNSYPSYAISVALALDGNLLIGVIYNPNSRETFAAIKDMGAYLNQKKITIGKKKKTASALISTGLPYGNDVRRKILKISEALVPNFLDLRISGSAVLELAFIACGRLDFYFECDLSPWDYAAGLLLVTEAGGTISTWEGNTLNLLDSNTTSIAAGNTVLVKEFTQLITKIST